MNIHGVKLALRDVHRGAYLGVYMCELGQTERHLEISKLFLGPLQRKLLHCQDSGACVQLVGI